jgi:predicted AlkP superfamily phosphohydrolase/phosphomutase
VKGREKYGIIDPNEYEDWRDKLIKLLKEIPDNAGNKMNTKIYRPEDLFSKIRGDAPDLLVYFDDLYWRSAGTVGYESMYLSENDTGPDDAVHDYYGILIVYDPKRKLGKKIETQSILNIAPTVLKIFEIEIPQDMEGTTIKF